MPMLMHLKILLPFQIFADQTNVVKLVAQTPDGSFGILPQRLDCVMALIPGVLNYVTATGENVYLAVDQGVLVKTGDQILVSVRHAIGGADLGRLHDAVQREFLTLDAQEKDRRSVIAKLESGLIRHMAEFSHAY
jgi:F-type H+-transporting ATPase subunit epsilon